MNDYKIGSRPLSLRRWAAWCSFGAGLGLFIYLMLAPGSTGIPGWEPVNDSLRATLAANNDPISLQAQAAPSTPLMPAVPSSAPATLPPGNPALLDLNAATVAELDGLPGIGPSKAQAIAAYREAHTGFRTVEELLEVKGIGPKLYEQIRPLVTVVIAVENAKSGGVE